MSEALAGLSSVERMLATIGTVGEAATVRGAAVAMREILRQAGASLDEQNRAAEAKIRAEWKGGRLLQDLEGHDGRTEDRRGRPKLSADGQFSPYAASLTEAGLTRQDAARWQKLATFDEDRLGALVEECREAQKEITTAYLLRAWRREEKTEKPGTEANALAVERLEELADGDVRFGTVYADPPWLYGNQGTRGATGDHYPGMAPEEIAALPIADLVAEDAHLHLWTTNAFLFDARAIIEAWGFVYKSCFVWVKPQMGMGNYWRVSHEFCLLGVRGSAPFGSRSEMSWREWPRGQHSAKPERMYEIIERVSPGPHLELFARRQRAGWTSWGNAIEADLFFPESALS